MKPTLEQIQAKLDELKSIIWAQNYSESDIALYIYALELAEQVAKGEVVLEQPWQPIETCKPFDGLVAYIGFPDGFYGLAKYADFESDGQRVAFWSLSDFHAYDVHKLYGNQIEPDKWYHIPNPIAQPPQEAQNDK